MFTNFILRVSFILGLLLLVFFGSVAQPYVDDTKGITQKLALVYYKINFTEEQRRALSGLELEFIFRVDSLGNPVLEDVNGLHDAVLLDSMKRAGPLPRIPVSDEYKEATYSLFFLKLQYPVYGKSRPIWGQTGITYKRLTLEDFEYVELSGRRIGFGFSLLSNFFAGNPSKHLGLGGGVGMQVGYTGGKRIGGSINLGFFSNKLKKEFPISSGETQSKSPGMITTAFVVHRSFQEKERSFWLAHLEAGVAMINIVPKENPDDKTYVQFEGFAPGFTLSYHRQVGKTKPGVSYLEPIMRSNYLIFHAGTRYLFMNHESAKGVMFEIGVGFGFDLRDIKEYRMR